MRKWIVILIHVSAYSCFHFSLHYDNTTYMLLFPGQFFRSGIEIDIENQMLHLPGKSPVPVKLRPIWKFMAKEVPENPVCWTTVKPSNQGEGLIQGQYKDYEVYSLIPVAVDV